MPLQNLKINLKYLGKGNTNVPGFDVPPVEDLLWGQTVSGNCFIQGQLYSEAVQQLNQISRAIEKVGG